jgi:hypothetical protein
MKITSNLSHILIIRGNYILPGVNVVKDKTILEHPSIIARIKNGQLIAEDSDFDFKSMHVSTLKKEIKDIYSIELLEKIMHEETRPSIVKAAEEQLEKLREED